jgi:hypothetical protein
MAESTEIAGVMTPSPYSSDAPTMPSRTRSGNPAPLLKRSEATSDSSARIPPSPSLSARRTRTTYLSDTIAISAHKIRETIPRTSAAVGAASPVALSVTEKV